MVVVYVEQQRRREQPWRRWDEARILPLPRRNRTGGGVEKVEDTTARLLMDWATCFRGGECARQRRCTVSNGGRLRWLGAARGEGERGKWRGAEREARRGFHLELKHATWRPRLLMRATRREAPAPVGHDGH